MRPLPFPALEMILVQDRKRRRERRGYAESRAVITTYHLLFTIHDLRFTILHFDKDPLPIQQPHQKQPEQNKTDRISQRCTNRWCPR